MGAPYSLAVTTVVTGCWGCQWSPGGVFPFLTSKPAYEAGPVIIPISQMIKVGPRGSQVSQPLSREPGFRPRPLLPALRRRKEGRAGERLEPASGRGCLRGGGGGGDPRLGEELVDWVRTWEGRLSQGWDGPLPGWTLAWLTLSTSPEWTHVLRSDA